jgi:elongation factor P--(R)-beta-lysine ligase
VLKDDLTPPPLQDTSGLSSGFEPLPPPLQRPPPPPFFSPSDLTGFYPPSPLLVRVAGRVIEASKSSLILADALGAVPVSLEEEASLEAGDLVVLEGLLRQGGIRSALVIERIQPARPVLRERARIGGPPQGEAQRLIERGVGRALASRAEALRTIRAFFERHRFLEVDTPCLVPSPGLDLHLDAFETTSPAASATPEQAGPRYLSTSPEYQMKRLLSGGVPRCFQLARCFRRGEAGRRHNPEFLMLEWYRAFAGTDEIMADTEDLVRHVAQTLAGGAEITVGSSRIDLNENFERLPVGEAFERYARVPADEAIALATSDETRFFRLLVEEVEPRLATERHPIFLINYPAPLASLARLRADDARVCERFELYIGGVELCNGFGELTDPREQRARFERDNAARESAGKPVYPIDERFLAALEEGMPPAAGNALGVDRLIALCLGRDEIASIQAFPAEWL